MVEEVGNLRQAGRTERTGRESGQRDWPVTRASKRSHALCPPRKDRAVTLCAFPAPLAFPRNLLYASLQLGAPTYVPMELRRARK